MYVDAISKCVEQIGELARKLSSGLDESKLEAATGMGWRGARAMREVLAHDYQRLDVSVLQSVLGQQITAIAVLDPPTVAGRLVQH